MVRLCAEKGEITVKALLTILIADTVGFLNVGKTMTDVQIGQTIDLILEDYSVYKIDYFILCFKRAKKGLYGKQYDRVDGQVIFNWLSLFDLEYQNEIEESRINEKKKIEKGDFHVKSDQLLLPDRDNTPIPMPDYVKDSFLNINKKIIPSKEQLRTPEQLIVDGFINDFNELLKNDFSPGKRFIYINGKMLDISEYINYRLLLIDNSNT